ncbi:RnfH family protein [Legionella spiritensis]|uniref:UPF0125 protein Lspi_1767 n=1 Tax=Legionella spiritensis TaxID=452 RepID=A0A0W0Z0B2_LEGSP|nr:RnfH family protein [Legionella spiritensis]KTD62555.1 Persistence and stress-resistance antitoxin PasI [Legionella spiritensis]SNV30668.1 protein yfjF [Legionella spiritensis]VEG91964.1 protein yfjF [Legionella spiritensis]
MINVELIYIASDQVVTHLRMTVAEGTTVGEAIARSGLVASHPETSDLPVGVFSRTVSGDTILKNGDRMEIYRPLTIDPKQKRRDRARSGFTEPR